MGEVECNEQQNRASARPFTVVMCVGSAQCGPGNGLHAGGNMGEQKQQEDNRIAITDGFKSAFPG
jgi:hypothetical protein